ncbi:L-2-hydroxyglutarate oxidase [Planctomycetota bacterium]
MRPEVDFEVVIVGGGIVGLATAYQIASEYDRVRVAVLEKEATLASHQTGHNSGVIHSGLYYRPGSVKAQTCTRGRMALVAFAKKHRIPHDICGKIIVATRENERLHLERVFEHGLANGIEGIQKIGPEQIKELEPECTGIAGIYVPCTGIIDYVQVAETLAAQITKLGKDNQVRTSQEVIGFDRHDFYTKVKTRTESYKARFVINCGGLQSDRLARLDGLHIETRIVPFRGDYYELTPEAGEKVKNLIYPVPDPRFPFLGVHFTRMIDGSVECGPNAVFAFKREGYNKLAFNAWDMWQSLSFSGTWKLFLRNMRYGAAEYTRAFSKAMFLRQLQRLVPALQATDIQPGKSGVRAQAVGKNGRPLDDFVIEKRKHAIHVLNAPSPAATACLAIGEHVAELAAEHFDFR